MSKLLWVALPLLAALALAALMALLRRRWPARHVVNIWSSLLLAAYVLSTAGLGIFWVANQQLPVFDWHYLFGYTTVALVVLHLAFNFGVVWRHLKRPRDMAGTPASPAGAPSRSAAPRRRLLAVAGLLAASGAAFVFGLRHGRSELRVLWPGGAAPTAPGSDIATSGRGAAGTQAAQAAEGMAFVERFHAFSSHSRGAVLLRAPGVDWGDPPPPFKHHPGTPRMLLPAPPATAAVARDSPFALAALADVLWHTAGVSDTRGPLKLRTSPSSGALFSTELYVAAAMLPGLPPGLWHYDAEGHALERLADTAPAAEALGALADAHWRGAAALIVATAVLRRTGHKYRDRGYRYVLADLGHALENLCTVARASGGRATMAARFDESRAATTLGVNEQDEAVLALLALHDAGAAPAGVERATRPASPQPPHAVGGIAAADDWRMPPAPDAQALPLGVTAAVHLASSLRRPVLAEPGALPAAGSGALELPLRPAQLGAGETGALRLIARRRSVRRFRPTPLTLADLAGLLAAMAPPADEVPLSTALRVQVVANAVEGLAPGAYRYDARSHRLQPRRAGVELRRAAQAAALDQDVIGGAAAVFVLSIDRAALAGDPVGPARAYRHAFIEAGRAGERVYLEGAARSLGVCAVGAFYDDEAAALVALDTSREWVVHFAALGVPAS